MATVGLAIPTVAGQPGRQRLRSVTGATGSLPLTVVPFPGWAGDDLTSLAFNTGLV